MLTLKLFHFTHAVCKIVTDTAHFLTKSTEISCKTKLTYLKQAYWRLL